jgi:hypothetical protein
MSLIVRGSWFVVHGSKMKKIFFLGVPGVLRERVLYYWIIKIKSNRESLETSRCKSETYI